MADQHRICPSCHEEAVHASRARSTKERIFKTVLPIRYYRCHACGWRAARMRLTARSAGSRFLALLAYLGVVAVVLLIAIGTLMLLMVMIRVLV